MKNSFAPAVLALTLGSAGTVAAADEAADISNLDEVLVVGQRDAPITVVPRGLSVSLGHTQFAAINALNVEDLMKYAPNFFVRKRFAGDDNAVVALRGTNTVQSARTLVMVDGFVVSNFLGNSYSFPPKWNVVGPSEVQQFDIVYGPYSARYGGNSMGGIVSVTTREPTESSGYVTLQSFAMPFEEYGFDETFRGYSVEAGGTWKSETSPWTVRVGARHFDNVGQSMTYNLLTPASGAGTPVDGAYADPRLATPVFGAAAPPEVTQDQARVRIGYVTDTWKLDGLFFGWQTRQDLSGARSFLTGMDGAPIYQGRVTFDGRTYDATGLTLSLVDRREYLAGIKAAGELGGWKTTLNLSRYWIASQDSRTSRDYARGIANGAGTLSLQDEPGWWTLDAGIERRMDRHRLAFGINANRYHTRQDNYDTSDWRAAAAPMFSSATYGDTRTTGVYAEDEIALEPVTLTLGARVDRWEARDGGIGKFVAGGVEHATYPRRDDTAFSPKLSIQRAFGAGREWNAQLSLGTATRFPSVGELFQGRFDDVTRAIDPQSFDPNLKPERSRDASFMLRREFESVSLTTSVFYQDIDDAIFSFSGLNQYGTVISSYKNIDEVRQYGLELIAEARDVLIHGLDVDLSVARIDARTVRNEANTAAENVRFPRIPDWRTNGNVRYRMSEALRASVGWRYGSRPNSDLFGLVRGDAYGFQTEYFFVDARVTWDATDPVQLSVGVDNLTNTQAYVSHPLPQRTAFAELRVRF